jgi:23S rRNA pseudouridine1911/1915/1917 synthase
MERTGLISPNSTFSFTIPEDAANKRLDHYIAQQFPLYSRSFFQRVIEDGLVSINGKQTLRQGVSLRARDTVMVQFPPERRVNPQALSEKHRGIEIVAQDPHFLVLFKPAGLVVHSPAARSTVPTLVDWLLNNHAEIASVGAVDRPGIVHRLDKDTSGIMIITRTNYAHALFGQMFKDRAISKTYLAVVHGHPPKSGIIDLPIGRDPRNPTKMTTFPYSAAGRSDAIRTACTNYTVLEYFENHSLVEARPVTGRTHQIRVHFAALGHSIVGDSTYGSTSQFIKRHALHAHKLAFTFDGTSHEFKYDAPNDFKTLLESVK